MKTIRNLMDDKVMKIAVLPPGNPQQADSAHYTLPLLAHDYPAKTAVMWNAAYQKFGLAVTNIMLIADPIWIEEIFKVFRQDEKYLGGGAGVGFKDKSLPYLDEIEAKAKAIGAVNFILKTPEGKLRGYNTDGEGYAQSLADAFAKRQETLAGKKVVVLGAGGTSNAVAFALAEKNARVVILNRTVEKARHLAEAINRFYDLSGETKARFGGELATSIEVHDADVVVNASTKGSAGELLSYSALAPVILPATEEHLLKNRVISEQIMNLIPRRAIVSDIVLVNHSTVFLRQARSVGLETLDGIPMVINQAVSAFWLLHHGELIKKGITEKTIKKIMQQAALG